MSTSSDAVLTLTSPPLGALLDAPAAAGDDCSDRPAEGAPVVDAPSALGDCGKGTCTCAPSKSGSAWLTSAGSAPASSPPALASASPTRAPAGNSYIPGLCTPPLTKTKSGPGVAVGAGVSVGARRWWRMQHDRGRRRLAQLPHQSPRQDRAQQEPQQKSLASVP